LKACGVVTGAAAKRNRFVSEIWLKPSAHAEKFIRLVRRSQEVVTVPPAQFIHQMLEVGREARRLWTQCPLQLFTHGVADRSARPAIDLFAVVGDSANHNKVPLLTISNSNEIPPDQVTGMENVSRRRPIACVSSED
jgi:hypothetical protein